MNAATGDSLIKSFVPILGQRLHKLVRVITQYGSFFSRPKFLWINYLFG